MNGIDVTALAAEGGISMAAILGTLGGAIVFGIIMGFAFADVEIGCYFGIIALTAASFIALGGTADAQNKNVYEGVVSYYGIKPAHAPLGELSMNGESQVLNDVIILDKEGNAVRVESKILLMNENNVVTAFIVDEGSTQLEPLAEREVVTQAPTDG